MQRDRSRASAKQRDHSQFSKGRRRRRAPRARRQEPQDSSVAASAVNSSCGSADNGAADISSNSGSGTACNPTADSRPNSSPLSSTTAPASPSLRAGTEGSQQTASVQGESPPNGAPNTQVVGPSNGRCGAAPELPQPPEASPSSSPVPEAPSHPQQEPPESHKEPGASSPSHLPASQQPGSHELPAAAAREPRHQSIPSLLHGMDPSAVIDVSDLGDCMAMSSITIGSDHYSRDMSGSSSSITSVSGWEDEATDEPEAEEPHSDVEDPLWYEALYMAAAEEDEENGQDENSEQQRPKCYQNAHGIVFAYWSKCPYG